MPPKATGPSSGAIAQHSLGVDAQTFVADAARGFGRSRAARQVTRQALYMDEEEDFVADNHPVSAARRLAIQRMPLEDNEEAHVDAGEELGDGEGDVQRTGMPQESLANKLQLRADLRDGAFMQRIKTKTVKATERTALLVEREKIVRTQAHNEALVRAKMRESSIPAFERLAAARQLAIAERDRHFMASGGVAPPPPPAATAGADEDADPNDKTTPLTATSTTATTTTTTRSAQARPQDARSRAIDDLLRRRAADRRAAAAAYEPPEAAAITIAELEKMLTPNPFGELGRKLQLGLLALPDMQAVVALLNPLLFEEEFSKSHFNTLEVIESMMTAGAKFVDMQRVKMKARLALALDAAHYGAYIVRGDAGPNDVVLVGGHEHFVGDETTLIVMEFRCVRRNLENNRDAESRKTRRVMVTELGEQYERELRPVVEDHDGDEAYVYEDVDDDYQDGNNLKDVAKHFIYKVTLVFVEALDVHCDDETVLTAEEAAKTTGAAKTAAEKAGDEGGDDEESESLDIFAVPKPSVPLAAGAAATEQMTDFRYDGGGPNDKESASGSDKESDDEEAEFLPMGKMCCSVVKARVLLGKWHANKLLGWLNGTQRPAPLCFRAYHISI